MIAISGYKNDSPEWAAAARFEEKALAAFPGLKASETQVLYIFPSIKTPFNANVKDVDLLILGRFIPALLFDNSGGEQKACSSLCISIEVKGHSASDVWLEGDNVWVNYESGPKGATEQSFKQVFAIQDLFKRKGFLKPPFVRNFVWLTNVRADEFEPSSDLPQDLILSDFLFQDILRNCFELQDGLRRDLNMISPAFDFDAAISTLSRVLIPTKLDRSRVENLTRDKFKMKGLKQLGKAQLSFVGFGGAGKTAILLRTAKELYEDRKRVLILTYNSALTSDLYRQLSWMKLNLNAYGESVNILTLHSFFIRWLAALQEIESDEMSEQWLSDCYLQSVGNASKKIRSGEISSKEIESVRDSYPARFNYEFVLVDEAQDWHDEERNLLYDLQDPCKLVLAIGQRQLVRKTTPCDWNPGPSTKVVQSSLIRCLRLKPNIAKFVSGLAHILGDDSLFIESDEELTGGEIFLVIGPLEKSRKLVEDTISANRECGNSNVDLLFCVNSSRINNGDATRRHSMLGVSLQKWRYEIYDAVDKETRMGLPTTTDDLRIVSFESSRGLEGWSVFLEGLDTFFEEKRRQSFAIQTDPAIAFLRAELASRAALDWCLIPLTRAIDTLVISIDDASSTMGLALLATSIKFPDFVKFRQ